MITNLWLKNIHLKYMIAYAYKDYYFLFYYIFNIFVVVSFA